MLTVVPDIQSFVHPDGGAILNPHRDSITTLNSSGAFIWREIERGRTTEEIAETLARETGKEFAEIEEDIHSFISDLKEKHLLLETSR